ncbi:MAG: hypothetical protein HYY62_00375, partial [Deltaproteobacteria bacterium]|nr:hypothetical protein [Deltaproteobacteria bacterium]
TISSISTVIIFSNGTVELHDSREKRFLPLFIQVQEEKVVPYRFSPNGFVSQIKLSPARDNEIRFRFTTTKGEKITFDDFRNEKVLTFNEEELLEYYVSDAFLAGTSEPIDTASHIPWKDPDLTEHAFRLEVGQMDIEGKNNNGHRETESIGIIGIDFVPIDLYQSSFLLGRYYHEGRGRFAKDQVTFLASSYHPWQTSDGKWNLGFSGSLLRTEDDKYRGFELVDVAQIGPSLRAYPFEKFPLKIDINATTAIHSETSISERNISRASQEWINHANQVNG